MTDQQTILQQHIAARAEVLALREFGDTRMKEGELRRALADAEQRRQALPLPLRAEMEAAVVAELETAAAERARLIEAWPALRLAEMEAEIEEAGVEIKIRYAGQHAAKLRLDQKRLYIELTERKAALSAAYTRRTANESRRQHIEQDLANRFGWTDQWRNLKFDDNWTDPATWPAIARRVVDAVAGELYEQRKQAIINGKLAELLAGNGGNGHGNGGQ